MKNTEALRDRLAEIDKISNDHWLATLEERKKKELEFHDLDRDRNRVEQIDKDTYEKFYGNRKYYQATSSSQEYVQNWIAENARGKVFLDYACGNGSNAINAAKAGASLAIGIDISRVSVENARGFAQNADVSANTAFVQADAENTQLPDKSIDVVICSGMLHHLDLSYAFPELRRIMAPGAKLLAVEALDYNPAIKLYRKLTPQMRTEWESAHILSLKDVEFATRFFDVAEVKYWHILSIAGPHMRPLMPLLQWLDKWLTRIPFVQRLAWIFTFELRSKSQK